MDIIHFHSVLENGDAKNQYPGAVIHDEISDDQLHASFDGEPPRYDNNCQKLKLVKNFGKDIAEVTLTEADTNMQQMELHLIHLSDKKLQKCIK